MQLPTLPVALLFISLASLGKAQFSTTFYPETTTDFDETSTVATTPEESWTAETTVVDAPSERTTVDSSEGTTSTDDQLETTTDSIATSGTTVVTPVEEEDGQPQPSDSLEPVENDAKKESVPEVFDGTTTKPERKPVVEPLFIKKYWPLLCFKTKCDRRHSSPAIPAANAPEVRTDLEESRSSNELVRALESEIIQGDDLVNVGEKEDKTDETTETDKTPEPERATTVTSTEEDKSHEAAAEEGHHESKESDESTEEASTAGTTKGENDSEEDDD